MSKLTKKLAYAMVFTVLAFAIAILAGANTASACNSCGCQSECKSGEVKCSSSTSFKICSEYCDGCWYWSNSRSCPTGTVCDSGKCIVPCSNQCTSGTKRCANGKVETCGNYDSDSCTEWGQAKDCDTGKTCTGNGECTCTSHVKKQCDGGDLYWYDSCNNKQELAEDCGSDELTENYRCAGDWTQREKIKRGCASAQCYKTSEWVNLENCATSNKKCDGGKCILTCADECVFGTKRCANGAVVTCGRNFDEDTCTEWGGAVMCMDGKTCTGNGECTCTSHVKKQCDGGDLYWYDSCNNKQELAEDCGSDELTENYRCAGDWTQREKIKRGCSYQQCFENKEWINLTDCNALGKKCDGGKCVVTCTNECAANGAKRCVGTSGYQTCGNYDSDTCLEWGGTEPCATHSVCKGNGICEHVEQPVTVDLTAPSSVACQAGFTLAWTSSNAFSCAASGAWTGNKAVNGSEAMGSIDSPKTYTITCTGEDGTAKDSVTVSLSGEKPIVNAGIDKETFETDLTTLNGSATGSGDLTYLWTCNGGTVENASTANATFKAPAVTQSTYYVCTLKVTNGCGSATDTINILVKNKTDKNLTVNLTANPKTGCTALKNVDLTAETAIVGGESSDEITYYFDCTNDGKYEKTVTTTARKYTAADLCEYKTKGTYTASVKISAIGLTDTAESTVTAKKCGGGGSSDPTVSLDGSPDNGCAPLKNVDLYAEVYPNGHGDDHYTYYFYCDEDSDDDDYDKKVTTSKTNYTAEELCNYSKSGTYTVRVRVESGNDLDIDDTATIDAESCGSTKEASLSLDKLVSNLTNGTGYYDSVVAAPGDAISFKITVKAQNGDIDNAVLTDILPDGVYNAQDIRIDGSKAAGGLESIDLGDLDENDTKTVTFTAYIAGNDSFAFGQTLLTNTAEANADGGLDDSDTATVSVSKTQVKGATTVSTGFTNNPLIDSFVIPAGIALFLIWALKAKLIKFEEWLDTKKHGYLVYKSGKMLDLQRAKLKIQKIADRF